MCVMGQMETRGGAIHHFKFNTCSVKLLYSLMFRRVEFRFDWSLLSSLSYFSLLLFCIDCVCVCFQVQLCHLLQILHIMVFVLIHSMGLFLSETIA